MKTNNELLKQVTENRISTPKTVLKGFRLKQYEEKGLVFMYDYKPSSSTYDNVLVYECKLDNKDSVVEDSLVYKNAYIGYNAYSKMFQLYSYIETYNTFIIVREDYQLNDLLDSITYILGNHLI